VSVHCFTDADHANDRVHHCLQTGVLIFVNGAPIIWFSKRQNTVETSTFGSEFVAMKISVELIESLCYKLQMFGMPIEGPADVFCDNQVVVGSAQHPDHRLPKKHNAIAYNKVRESVAQGTIRVAKEDTKTNLADVFTKPLPSEQRDRLFDAFLH
jgi:hypothetical protein